MRYKNLLDRIAHKQFRAAAEKVSEVAEAFMAKRAAIDADTQYSASGRVDAIAAEFERSYGPSFRLARAPLRAARQEIESRRTKVAMLPAVDRSDIVGAIERMEKRAFIASLSEADRTKLLFSGDTDRRLVDAVLSGDAPPELSGLPRERYAALLDMRLRELYGSEIAAIEQDEAALAAAEATVQVAHNDIKNAFPDAQRFEKLMNKAVVPWLVDRGVGSVAVVRIDANGQASYEEATPEERRIGRRFASVAEYNAQQSA